MHKHLLIWGNSINRHTAPYCRNVFIILAMLVAAVPMLASASPTLSTDTNVATAGYYRLSWGAEETKSNAEFILQESTTSNFENPAIIYKGPDLATVVSGKSNGEYFYRVRRDQQEGPQGAMWSDVVNVNVKHHSLTKAVGFFIAGLIVFAATLYMIISGARKTGD